MLVAGVVRVLVFIVLEQGRIGGGGRTLSIALMAFWQYLRLLLVPAGQTIFHGIPGPATATLLAELALTAVTLALALRLRTRIPAAVFGVCWFVVAVAPAVMLGAIDGGSAVAEHRAYLPAVGFVLLVGSLAGEAMPLFSRFRSTRLLAPLALAAVLLMLSGRTYIRNLVWADPINLWQEATRYAPDHWLPFEVVGESLHAAGRHQEAVNAFRRSVALDPSNDAGTVNLVLCLAELKRESEAMETAAALERVRPAAPVVPLARGAVAAVAGRSDEARRQFLEVIARDPGNVMARQWLAVLAEQSGDRSEALNRCYELQRLIPGRSSVDGCIERTRQGTSVISR
jgi:tetratricopeptide (TPR) repeat protein